MPERRKSDILDLRLQRAFPKNAVEALVVA